jgi:uncharacterized protein (TIGR02284 family)
MESKNADAISALSNLIEYNKDGQQIYHTASQEIKNPKIQPIFTKMEQHHSKIVNELQEQVLKLGGNENYATTGRVQTKPWAEVQTAIKNKNERAVIEQFEKTENAIESQYDQVLKQSLPTNIKEVIQKQHDKQRDARNQIRSLKDSIS